MQVTRFALASIVYLLATGMFDATLFHLEHLVLPDAGRLTFFAGKESESKTPNPSGNQA